MNHDQLVQIDGLEERIESLEAHVSAQAERIIGLEAGRDGIERDTAERIAAWLEGAVGYHGAAKAVRDGAWRSIDSFGLLGATALFYASVLALAWIIWAVWP